MKAPQFSPGLWILTILLLSFSLNAAELISPEAAGKWPAPSKKKTSSKKTSPNKKIEEPKKPVSDEKPFQEVVKDFEVVKGLFTFYRKADENKVYLEILPSQLNTNFLFSGTIDQSVGERGLYSSQMGGQFPFFFRMVGKNVQWVARNSRFSASPGTPASRAVDRSFAQSILASARVLSQPHPERKSVLINLSDLLLNDLPGFALALKEAYKPSDYRFDRSNSSILAVKTFPENTLLELLLHYTSENPKVNSLTVPDERSIPILVKYDLSRIRESNYKPRYADDRVGHFLSVQQDFTTDRPSTPYVRRIHRWNLEKADPSATLSAPKQPIVFWLENTIPVEYREWMKEGALLWNKTFERIGFKDAIVVRQQPDNADWDPADTRYNTIRWFAGVDATFAIGPSRANPYTGEIYDADIGFSEGIIRSVRRNGEEFIAPSLPHPKAAVPSLAWDSDGAHFCQYADGLAHQAAFGINVLESRGWLNSEMEQKLMREFIIQVTAHEVGHTLGLRHNFRASTLLKPEQLLDEHITSEMGQSSSVMDYNPIVLAAKSEKQGHFVPVTLGPYDYWAIEYAYKIFPENEEAELRKIATRAADPGLAYSTDEDALGTFSANAADPLVNQFDQSSDPLAYFEKRIGIIKVLWQDMEANLVREGEGYQVLRRAVARSMSEYYRALLTASKFIGGLYHHRDHAGDPNGRAPFVPVAAEKQKQALAFLQRFAFCEDAFALPPGLYNKLASERLPGLDGINALYNAGRVDYPWHTSVLNLQQAVLNRLHQPVALARLQDNELRFSPGEPRFTMADFFTGLQSSIWSELTHPGEISSTRRNLQREHLKILVKLVIGQSSGAPEDASSLARATLRQLDEQIAVKLQARTAKDPATLAHLEETHARIKAALDAQIAKSVD